MTIQKVTSTINMALGYFKSGNEYFLRDNNKRPLLKMGKNLPSQNQEVRSEEERTKTAVLKSNETNFDKYINPAINASAVNDPTKPETDVFYDRLLNLYSAYKNPEVDNMTLGSGGVLSASYRGKSVEIRVGDIDDEKRQQEINFDDGSQVCYTTFLKDGKMTLNGEQFDIPEGTVVETKSVKGRMFSHLIQLPDMQREYFKKPEYLAEAEKILSSNV